MPGNTIVINKLDELEWYVGDSKMNKLIEWLDKNGVKTGTNIVGFEPKVTKSNLLVKWLEELVYPGLTVDFVQDIGVDEPSDGEIEIKVCLYTEEYKYQVVAIDRSSDDGYLGCQVSTRKPRAGESWSRGNDLPDGPFNRDTWNKILNAMINYELVKLSRFQKPDAIPEDAA